MDLSIPRRTFLGGTAAGVGFAFAGDGSLETFARPAPEPSAPMTGYGPLIPDPDKILALPRDFSYKVLAQSGLTETRNGPFPSDPDGMGVFRRRRGGSILISNHENATTEPAWVPGIAELTYDEQAIGGTTTIVVDRDGERIDAYTSLAGTDNNCAGGITPWKTWLTCEETERRRGDKVERLVDGRFEEVSLTKDHGYVFEVDPRSQGANRNRSPVPLKFMGRYSHEAVAVDPDRHRIYLTEDANDPHGLYYRWTPPRWFRGGKGALLDLADDPNAGRLQAMSCYAGDQHVPDLSVATAVGTVFSVRWIDVPDRDAATASVRNQFGNHEITRSRKLEGQWWGNNGAYFVASYARRSDGSAEPHDGQVWFYDPAEKTVTLKTFFGMNPQPDRKGTFDGPDNITVSTHGGLILAEDGRGIQHLIGVSASGYAYPLARNQVGGNEFCGPAFSADGRTLFVNTQSPGYTFAITGPWRRG